MLYYNLNQRGINMKRDMTLKELKNDLAQCLSKKEQHKKETAKLRTRIARIKQAINALEKI